MQSTGATVRFNAGRAFYSLTEDYIGMPERGLFETSASYYAALIHELTHWSGHQSRLDRLSRTSRYGSESYAFEELVAELGASFFCSEFEMTSDLPNHASYLEGWLRVLNDDHKAIFRAAAEASKAASYIKAMQPSPLSIALPAASVEATP